MRIRIYLRTYFNHSPKLFPAEKKTSRKRTYAWIDGTVQMCTELAVSFNSYLVTPNSFLFSLFSSFIQQIA